MNDNDWTIRPAQTSEEWERALELLTSVFVSGGYTRPDAAPRFLKRSVIDGTGEFLVGVDGNGEVLGAVLLVMEPSRMRQVARDGEAEFRILGVGDEARGRGVGRGLVEECLTRARAHGMQRMVLSTQPTMLAAHALYESLGFIREPERDWTTSEGSARLVYGMDM
jgi:ribosomal protein S18 acetylase RimI-like enzyme